MKLYAVYRMHVTDQVGVYTSLGLSWPKKNASRVGIDSPAWWSIEQHATWWLHAQSLEPQEVLAAKAEVTTCGTLVYLQTYRPGPEQYVTL